MKKKKSKKKIIIGAAAVLVVAGGVTVAGQRNSTENQIPQVQVVTAEKGDVEEIVDATGTVGSEEEKTYYSPVNAELKTVSFAQGEGMGYHETTVPEGDSASSSPDLQSSTDFFASATAIRSLIQNPGGGHSEAISDINNPVRNPDTKTANILSSQIPPDAFYVFKKALDSGEFLTENSLDSILSYCLMKENVESLSSYMDVSEDLARRIINQQNLLLSFSQSVSVLKTRELTQTRIQRALLHIILNIHTAPTQIPFARVLGFRKESSELLSRIKQHSRIPLITKLADAQNLLDSEGNQILSETVFSSNLYEKLLCLKTGRKFCHESQKQLIIL